MDFRRRTSRPWGGCPSTRCNGACEAGIGSLETRAHRVATRHGRPGEWTCDDVETARLIANETARPRGTLGPTPDELWAARLPPGDRNPLHGHVARRTTKEREHFMQEMEREPNGKDEDAIARIAMCHALVWCGHLQLRKLLGTLFVIFVTWANDEDDEQRPLPPFPDGRCR